MAEPTLPTYSASTERVQTWLGGSALHIRFNNPARHNALSVDMWEAVPPLLDQARGDDRVRLVVFSGAGDKAFVSGADITQFEDMRAAREAVTHYEKMAEATLMATEVSCSEAKYLFSGAPLISCPRLCNSAALTWRWGR